MSVQEQADHARLVCGGNVQPKTREEETTQGALRLILSLAPQASVSQVVRALLWHRARALVSRHANGGAAKLERAATVALSRSDEANRDQS